MFKYYRHCFRSDTDRDRHTISLHHARAIQLTVQLAGSSFGAVIKRSLALKMTLVKHFLPVLRVFQFCGLSPFSVIDYTFQLANSKRSTAYSFLLFGCTIGLFIYDCSDSDAYRRVGLTTVTDFVDTGSIVFVRLIALICLLEAILTRQKQIDFFNQLTAIDAIFSNELNVAIRPDRSRWRPVLYSFKRFAALLLATIILGIIVILSRDLWYLKFWVFYSISWFVVTFSNIQMSTYVQFIRCHFEMLNDQLAKLMSKGFERKISAETHSQFGKMLILRNIHNRLWKATNLTNERFKWSLPFSVCSDFAGLLLNCYWIFLCIFQPATTPQIYIYSSSIWCITNFLHLALPAHCCQLAIIEVNETFSNVRYASVFISGTKDGYDPALRCL